MISQNMDFESSWNEIQTVIDKAMDILCDVYGEKPPAQLNKKEYVHTYSLIFSLANQRDSNNGELLYQKYQGVIKNYLKKRVAPSVRQLQGAPLLLEVSRRYTVHLVMVKLLNNLFAYINRSFVATQSLMDLRLVAHHLFIKEVFQVGTRMKLVQAFHQEITAYRRDQDIQFTLLKDVFKIFTHFSEL